MNETVINLNGYQDLNWNDSIEKFLSIYPEAVEIAHRKYFIKNDPLRVFCFEQVMNLPELKFNPNRLSNEKLKKHFYFLKNELFKVTVDYGILLVQHTVLLSYKLYKQYGEFDWIINEKFGLGLGVKIVNENLRIILTYEDIVREGFGDVGKTHAFCSYENRKKVFGPWSSFNLERSNVANYQHIQL